MDVYVRWVMTMLPLIQGTAEVPLARLAAKSLKFAPPSWLLNGTWDWVVEFDGDISIDMAGLRPMLDEHQDKPLLLLKWYWRDCAPWDCFLLECEDMLTKRKEYVQTSYENVIKWRDELTKYHNDPLHPFEPADYYELGIMFRNVAHEKSPQISSAFKQVLEHCRTIQRDQFLLPFYLWNSSLDKEVEALSISKLNEQLKYCVVQTRRGRNLLAAPATSRSKVFEWPPERRVYGGSHKGAILLRRFEKLRFIFRGRRSTLDVSIFIFRGRRSTFYVSCSVFFANPIVRAASSGENVQIVWQEWHFLTRDVETRNVVVYGGSWKSDHVVDCRNVGVYGGSCKSDVVWDEN
eukprot:s1717_g15.t1